MNSSMMDKEHLKHIQDHICTHRCISWSAVIMGALVAIAFSFLLNLLCLGIGVSAFPTTTNGQIVFAVSGFVVLIICSILAMFPAGFVAGKLSGKCCLKRRAGEIHGIGAWTVALIVSVLMGASVGKFVNQASYMVTRQPVEIKLTNLSSNQVYTTTQRADNTEVKVDPDKAADAAAMALFATFFIFFIGMLSAAFGGRCGIMCNRKELAHEHCEKCVTK